MTHTVSIIFSMNTTTITEHHAEVDPAHYTAWCVETENDPTDLRALEEYIVGTEDRAGQVDHERYFDRDEIGQEFRDFDDADAGILLVNAAANQRQYTLREIAINEASAHGNAFPRWPQDIADTHGISLDEAKQVTLLVGKARVSL